MKKTPITKRKASDHLAKEDFLLPEMAEIDALQNNLVVNRRRGRSRTNTK